MVEPISLAIASGATGLVLSKVTSVFRKSKKAELPEIVSDEMEPSPSLKFISVEDDVDVDLIFQKVLETGSIFLNTKRMRTAPYMKNNFLRSLQVGAKLNQISFLEIATDVYLLHSEQFKVDVEHLKTNQVNLQHKVIDKTVESIQNSGS